MEEEKNAHIQRRTFPVCSVVTVTFDYDNSAPLHTIFWDGIANCHLQWKVTFYDRHKITNIFVSIFGKVFFSSVLFGGVNLKNIN